MKVQLTKICIFISSVKAMKGHSFKGKQWGRSRKSWSQKWKDIYNDISYMIMKLYIYIVKFSKNSLIIPNVCLHL